MGQLVSVLTKITILLLSPLANKIVKEHVLECEKREQDLELLHQLSTGRVHALPRQLKEVPSNLTSRTLSKSSSKAFSKGQHTQEVSTVFSFLKDASTTAQLEYALCPLSEKQDAIVEYALDDCRSLGTVLACKFDMNMTRRDMLTLHANNWLNNEIINFYMKLIMERGPRSAGQFPHVYCFSAFFYPKLVKDGPYAVKRWTRNADLFAYEMAFIPLHIGLHWCMVCINVAEQKVVCYDSGHKGENNCLNVIMQYLKDEYEDKLGLKFDGDAWRMEFARGVPQQVNAGDCGVFACAFAEFLSRKAPFVFSYRDIELIRKRMVVEIMIGELLV